jgi:cytochrome oxidase Cu insertion factor (SCO1/SenC/PrrC family)
MTRLNQTAALFVAAVGLAVVLVAGCGGGGSTEVRMTGPGPYRGSEPPSGLRLPSFTLSNVVTGRTVRSDDLEGSVVLVTFLDSDCSHQCPIIAGQIGRALNRLPASALARTRALVVSVNPLVDTRASVKRFLREHRVLGRVDYLTGSVAALRPVWKDFGVVSAYETGDADTHSADVRVFDPVGVWVSTQHVGVDLTPANLAHDVATALDSGA